MKKLKRSNSDSLISGVCGGLATYFEIDSSLIRILMSLFICFTGFGLLLYIILWICMPSEDNY